MAQIEKVRYTHDAMIDLIVANPAISQGQIASHFGYTQAWISQVINSDAFQERLAQRRSELIDPIIMHSTREKFQALLDRSVEVLVEKLSMPSTVVPDNLALKAAELGAKAAGLGGFGVKVVEQRGPSTHLEELAQRLLGFQEKVRGEKVLEGEYVEVRPGVRPGESANAQAA